MKYSTVAVLILVGLGLLTLGFAVGRMTVMPNPITSLEPVVAPAVDADMPTLDVPGEDIPDLPPYPGSTRVEYRQVMVNDLLETEVEYVLSGELEPVRDFYRRVFDDEGWSVADLGIHQGELTFFVINGSREALVELESRGSLVEIEIELSEPVAEETLAAPVEP